MMQSEINYMNQPSTILPSPNGSQNSGGMNQGAILLTDLDFMEQELNQFQ